jgi:hypothetical protein
MPIASHGTTIKNSKDKRQEHKKPGKNRSGTRKQVCRSAAGHESTHALTVSNA